MEYDRESDLRGQFNQFFEQLGISDLYSKLSNNQLIDLKKLLSCINNMITLRATDTFVLKLYQDGFIDSKEKTEILGKVLAADSSPFLMLAPPSDRNLIAYRHGRFPWRFCARGRPGPCFLYTPSTDHCKMVEGCCEKIIK